MLLQRACLLAALSLCSATALAAPAEVHNIRLWSEGAHTRVVLDLSERVAYNLFPLRNPDRLVIDIADGRLDKSLATLPDGTGVVAGVRAATRGNDDLRIVLDLSTVARPRTSFAGPLKSVGERLVIDLVDPGVPQARRSASVADLPARDIVVAIDPGHGGRDPGAMGRGKTREKDVVLAIAKRLARRIDAEPGMQAYLTRREDRLVAHRERMESARRKNADLFISIHADAFTDARAHGSSVYALSLTGASNEAARRLAESQNAALIGGVTLSDKDAVLASVLMDLSQNAAISAGIQAGSAVLKELGRVGRVHKRKVQQANFAVLRSPDVPSILVETAFISNPDEERRLRDAAHQERLATAVFNGVRNYFRSNPPPDTLYARRGSDTAPAAPAEPIRHVIVRGDTLSEIAERYNVRMSTLRSVNKLRDDRVRVGQVLTIPIGS
ncbi:MAG: N-acetylmuramoyl-L-alanine amidase [Pseudomonadota bacterium]